MAVNEWPAPPAGVRRISDAWAWRREILSERGPPDAATRFTLLVMSTWMDPDATRCFPGVREIARKARLSKNTVARCRREAIRLGFLIPPEAGIHARGRQDWIACLPPLTPAVSPLEGQSNRSVSPQCPRSGDLPAIHQKLREEGILGDGPHGF